MHKVKMLYTILLQNEIRNEVPSPERFNIIKKVKVLIGLLQYADSVSVSGEVIRDVHPQIFKVKDHLNSFTSQYRGGVVPVFLKSTIIFFVFFMLMARITSYQTYKFFPS